MKSIQKYLPVLLLVALFFVLSRVPIAQKGMELFSDSLAEVSWEWRQAREVHTKLTELIATKTQKKEAQGSSTEIPQGEELIVTEVVDGDTLRGTIDDKETMVRLIGINTPETGGPYRQKECFGVEAKNALQDLVGSEKVILKSDDSQANTDKYDRLLRYVFMSDGTHIGEYLIKEGFAFEYTYSNAYQYQKIFRAAEEEAKKEQKGLWAAGACQPKPTLTE